MNKNVAAAALTAFLYAQGLLCIAAVASVLLRDRTGDVQMSSQTEMASPTTAAISL